MDVTASTQTRGLFNPDHAVLFADGRIGVIPSVVTYEELPEEVNADDLEGYGHWMIIFAQLDGEWLVDENLWVCLGNCEEGTLIPGILAPLEATPITTPGA